MQDSHTDDTRIDVEPTDVKRSTRRADPVERQGLRTTMVVHDMGQRDINNKPLDRELEQEIEIQRGNFSYSSPWGGRSFPIPEKMMARFDRAGFKLQFILLNDITIKMYEGYGGLPVPMSEAPEWSVSQIPSSDSAHQAYQNYCICVDQILIKIHKEDFERLQREMNKHRALDQRTINHAKILSKNMERQQFGQLQPLNLPTIG